MKKTHPGTGRAAVTNEELARMIAAGFEQTATKQDVQSLEKRVGNVEGRLGDVEGRLKDVEGRLGDVDDRLRIVETKLDRALYSEFVHFEMRLKRLEQKVGIGK